MKPVENVGATDKRDMDYKSYKLILYININMIYIEMFVFMKFLGHNIKKCTKEMN